MSTCYYLLCHDHKCSVHMMSRMAGAASLLYPLTLVDFADEHAGCRLEVVTEHDERLNDFTEQSCVD